MSNTGIEQIIKAIVVSLKEDFALQAECFKDTQLNGWYGLPSKDDAYTLGIIREKIAPIKVDDKGVFTCPCWTNFNEYGNGKLHISDPELVDKLGKFMHECILHPSGTKSRVKCKFSGRSKGLD